MSEQPANMTVTPLTGPLPEWARLQLDLRKWMSGWVDDLVERHAPLPWRGGHDEALFARTLPAFYMLTGYRPALELCEHLGRQLVHSTEAEACDCFLTEEDRAAFGGRKFAERYHGYLSQWSCLCHAPENYSWFLAHLAHVSEDPAFTDALTDVAEHVANLSPDVPDWFDFAERRFRSTHLGTRLVRDHPPYDYDCELHFRVMTIALNAYALTGDTRYLEPATAWLDRWAEVVLTSPAGVPSRLYPAPDDRVEALYGEFASRNTSPIQYELAHLLLDVHRVRPSDAYADAVRTMICRAAGCEDWALGALLVKYRVLTGDRSFDQAVVDRAEESLSGDEEVPGFVLTIDRAGVTGFDGDVSYVSCGPGRSVRADRRSVALFAAAHQITGDRRFLEAALRLAWMRFWAAWYLWDGREFGCRGSWTGRNGVAMHNVIPALALGASGGFPMVAGEIPMLPVVFQQACGRPGLPEGVAAEATACDARIRLELANSGTKTVQLLVAYGMDSMAPVRQAGALKWSTVSIPAGSTAVCE